jgi:capsular exopolysaccharide synthesis family protein
MGYIFDAMKRRLADGKPTTDAEVIAPGDPFENVYTDSPREAARIGEHDHVDDGTDPQLTVDPSTADMTGWDERIVCVADPHSQFAEEYRAIRTSMLARWQHRRHLVHTITSATPQEGKTITSLNLGLTFAELRNRKTIVIEADLRLPQFSKLLKLPDGPGIIDYLEGDTDLQGKVQAVGPCNLHVLAAGGRSTNDAVQLLSGPLMASLIKRLRAKYDHVIIDTPPVVDLADAGILGAMSDEVLLIARLARTPRTLIDQAVRTLNSYDAPVAGVIATDQRRTGRGYYYKYKYGYRYRYQHRHSYRKAA